MALSKEAVDKQLATLGNINTYWTKKEIKYLPEVLNDDEVIHGISSGFIDRHTWLCVVTQKRILLIDKGMISGLSQLEFPISQIKSVSFKTGMIFSELLVDTGGQLKKIEQMQKPDAAKLSDIIAKLLHNKPAEQATTTDSPKNDIVSQLERLATLKEKGLLTEDEFAAQKAKLLS